MSGLIAGDMLLSRLPVNPAGNGDMNWNTRQRHEVGTALAVPDLVYSSSASESFTNRYPRFLSSGIAAMTPAAVPLSG